MILKKHFDKNRLILALCDDDLLGKQIEEGRKILDCSSAFYSGEPAQDEDVLSYAKKAYIVNAVGKRSVSFLLKNRLGKSENVAYVCGTPHLIVILD